MVSVTQFRDKGAQTFIMVKYSTLKVISKQRYVDLNTILHLTLKVHTSVIRTLKHTHESTWPPHI